MSSGGWLQRRMKQAREEISNWPSWRLNAARIDKRRMERARQADAQAHDRQTEQQT